LIKGKGHPPKAGYFRGNKNKNWTGEH